MKAIIKYLLVTVGPALILAGLNCNLSHTWQAILCMLGSFMYIIEKTLEIEDEQEHEKKISNLEKKVRELEAKLLKEEQKPKVNLEDVPMNYDEYLKRVSDKFNGKTL